MDNTIFPGDSLPILGKDECARLGLRTYALARDFVADVGKGKSLDVRAQEFMSQQVRRVHVLREQHAQYARYWGQELTSVNGSLDSVEALLAREAERMSVLADREGKHGVNTLVLRLVAVEKLMETVEKYVDVAEEQYLHVLRN